MAMQRKLQYGKPFPRQELARPIALLEGQQPKQGDEEPLKELSLFCLSKVDDPVPQNAKKEPVQIAQELKQVQSGQKSIEDCSCDWNCVMQCLLQCFCNVLALLKSGGENGGNGGDVGMESIGQPPQEQEQQQSGGAPGESVRLGRQPQRQTPVGGPGTEPAGSPPKPSPSPRGKKAEEKGASEEYQTQRYPQSVPVRQKKQPPPDAPKVE